MSTTYKKLIESYSKHFDSNKRDDIQHLKQMLMYRFLSEVERVTDEKSINRKDLAKLIGVSPSYLTQLYRGSKPLNIETLAKIEDALNFRFEIKAVEKEFLELNANVESTWDEDQINNFISRFTCSDGFWIYRKHRNEFNTENILYSEKVDYSVIIKPLVSTHKQKIKIKSA